MPSSAGDGVSAVSAQPKERSRNVVARAAAFRLLGAYVQGWTVLEQCRSNCRGKRDSFIDGNMRGWAYDRQARVFNPDGSVEQALNEASMESMIRDSDAPSTLTCTPWGSGIRVGIDRDGDSILDFDELRQGSNPAQRESTGFRASSGLWFNPDRSGSGMDLRFPRQATALPFTGLWYDPAEPGYGLSIDTQGDTRVIVIYFYDQQSA